MSEFDVILRMDWLIAYKSLSIVSVGGLPPIRRMVLVWYFKGDKHYILPHTVYESKCQGHLTSWLASLTLEDEERLTLASVAYACA